MNDSEIIKALEYCANHKDCDDGCPCVISESPCVVNNPNTLFDLIKRQQAEIERLKKQVVEKHTEINRLDKYMQYVRNETIKEFAEKLKTEIAGLEVKSPSITYKCGIEYALYYRMPKIIDRLVGEMGCNDG